MNTRIDRFLGPLGRSLTPFAKSRFTRDDEKKYSELLLDHLWLSRVKKIVGIGMVLHWISMVVLTHMLDLLSATYTMIMDFGILLPLTLVSTLGCFRKEFQRNRVFDFCLMINSVAWVFLAVVQDHLCKEAPTATCQVDNTPIRANMGLYITFGPFIQLYVFDTHKLMYAVVVLAVDVYLGALVFVGPTSQYPLYIIIVVFQMFMFLFAMILDDHRRTSFQLQQALAHEIEETKRVEEKKRQLTGYVFHEIRVPLNTLIQSVNLLQQDKANLDKDLIEVLNTGLHSIETLLNDVLDFQKIAEGFFHLNPQPCDIHQSILTIVHIMAASANAKGVAVTTDLDLNVPRCLVLDDFRFRQVVANLVSNAIKFTPERKNITVHTSVMSMSLESADVCVAVRDEGIGISAENIKRLFKPWVQIDAQVNQAGKGSGLGLAICANIVQAFGGTYGIDSTVGSGSTFWFRFSANVGLVRSRVPSKAPSLALVDAAAPTSKASAPPAAAVVETPLHILIVDDDKVSRMMMQRILKSLGHTTELAADGQEAVDRFAAFPVPNKCPFDAIFIDNYMPRMTGTEAIKWLRSHGWTDILIVSTTASSLIEEERGLFDAGANRVARKPININVVREILAWVRCGKSTESGRES
ncbi:hypothetical protein HDU86_006315 [Geranomyces michiganensis]|nr:hypothetical protein HDU86_006315 [Geranomyces michiganensis]